MPARRRGPVASGAAYFLILFACGFVLGAVRVLLLVPSLGEVAAVLLELPVMLSLSWLVARRLTRGRPALAGAWPRLAMGAVALALLLAAELALAVWGFGQSLAEWRDGLRGSAGLLGLAGQILFGLIPWIQHVAGRR